MSIKQSSDPLLYIIQPSINFPKSNMQETYVLKKTEPVQEKDPEKSILDIEGNQTKEQAEKEIDNMEKKGKKSIFSIEKGELKSADVQDVINEYNDKQDEEQKSSPSKTRKQHSFSMKRVKSFMDMDTIERLNYLIHFPKQLPPVPCIFTTKSSTIKGFLLKKTEEAIEVKQFNEKTLEILLEDLVDVKMIGLK